MPDQVTAAFDKLAFDMFMSLPKAWRRLGLFGRAILVLGLAAYVCAAILFFVVITCLSGDSIPTAWAWGVGAAGIVGLFTSSVIVADVRRLETEQRFEAAEVRVRENPEKSRYAWDLARIKLESYLDRNLGQVSAIFYLTVVVMTFGMGLIGFGVWRSINDPAKLLPASLAAISGVVVQIVAGTFLVIYRSTMEQARNYVVVLERINAVGMSINILDTIDEASAEARDAARSELAKDLLKIYAPASTR